MTLPVLILQHPQEPDAPLGTAGLLCEALPQCTLKVGLSWANLSKALGREAQAARWGVLYFGSGLKAAPKNAVAPGLYFVNRKGLPTDPPPQPLEGLVVLDGTWSQAKSLWWKNAWLLKLKRLVLYPQAPSLYREMRREPKPECVSTLEATAETLTRLGEDPTLEKNLKEKFTQFLSAKRR